MNATPPILIVPVRGPPAVAETLKATDADPLPLAPDVIAIQSESEDADHGHNGLDARTSTLPVPPADGKDADLAPRSIRQSAAS